MESTALEVSIGLAVIFVLDATVVTAANEALTRLLTAFAVALGGPFWFGAVGALAGLRRKQK